jgi:hypothetical protein
MMGRMPESPLLTLERWEDAGAGWRLARPTASGVVVELLACTGEVVDHLESGDPALRAYLAVRPSSEDPRPAAGR